jgi:anthranilate synthase/indole-3-glycerol phosphate synthase/phosphoribosylanthranilate isomerase
VAILDDATLIDLMHYSRNIGMEPLVEVASEEEMKRALQVGAQVIGVNNRDLNTFQVNMNRTTSLASLITKDVILLALSGINSRQDVETYLESGAKGVLVGETLMRSQDKVAKVQELLGVIPKTKSKPNDSSKKVKICGLTNSQDALLAARNGADYLGFIFAKQSPRYIDPKAAREIVLEIRKVCPIEQQTFESDYIPKPESASNYFKPIENEKPMIVGVFTDSSAHEINEITNLVGIDMIQLHLPRDSTFHRLLNRPIIQVVGLLDGKGNLNQVIENIQSAVGSCAAILLDTCIKGVVGGTGKRFESDIVTELGKRGIHVWMAGGLEPENVKDALEKNPLVVDVSSGIEKSPGIKDHKKLVQFLLNCEK